MNFKTGPAKRLGGRHFPVFRPFALLGLGCHGHAQAPPPSARKQHRSSASSIVTCMPFRTLVEQIFLIIINFITSCPSQIIFCARSMLPFFCFKIFLQIQNRYVALSFDLTRIISRVVSSTPLIRLKTHNYANSLVCKLGHLLKRHFYLT